MIRGQPSSPGPVTIFSFFLQRARVHYLLPLPYHFVVIVRQCPEGTTPRSNSAKTHNAPDTQLSHTARTHRCTQQVQASSQDSQDSREVQDSIKTRTSFIDSARAPRAAMSCRELHASSHLIFGGRGEEIDGDDTTTTSGTFGVPRPRTGRGKLVLVQR